MTNLALPDLAQAIDREHQAAHQAARTAIEHAIECGRLLLEAKASVGHGGWLPWIEANLSFGDRQARKYMRLTRHAEELSNRHPNSDLSIDGALALLAGPRTGHHRTIFDEILDLGGKLRPQGLELPEGLPLENWAKIGELLGKLERGSDDLNTWVIVQAAIYQKAERLLADLERLEPRQTAIREAVEAGHQPPADAESVVERTRAWCAQAETWRQGCARYHLAVANAQLGEAVKTKLQAQRDIVHLEEAAL